MDKKKTTTVAAKKRKTTKKDVVAADKAKKIAEEFKGELDVAISKAMKKTKPKDDVVVENKTNTSSNTKSESIWLEEQITALSEQVKQLEDELVLAKEENILLKQGGTSNVGDSNHAKNITWLYNDIKRNYWGDNAQKIRYEQSNNKVLLERLERMFPFLTNS